MTDLLKNILMLCPISAELRLNVSTAMTASGSTPCPNPSSAHEHPHPVRSTMTGQPGKCRRRSAGEWRDEGGIITFG